MHNSTGNNGINPAHNINTYNTAIVIPIIK